MLKLGDIVLTRNKLRGVVTAISTGTLIDTVIIMLSAPVKSKTEFLNSQTYSITGVSPYNKILNVDKVIGNIFTMEEN